MSLIERLREEAKNSEHAGFPNPLYAEVIRQLEAMQAEIERLREALSFYAKPHNWLTPSARPCGHLDGSNVLVDQGCKARASLTPIGDTEEQER